MTRCLPPCGPAPAATCSRGPASRSWCRRSSWSPRRGHLQPSVASRVLATSPAASRPWPSRSRADRTGAGGPGADRQGPQQRRHRPSGCSLPQRRSATWPPASCQAPSRRPRPGDAPRPRRWPRPVAASLTATHSAHVIQFALLLWCCWSAVLPSMKRGVTQNRRSAWGCSSAGRAPALQAGGRGFESHHLHRLRLGRRRRRPFYSVLDPCYEGDGRLASSRSTGAGEDE